MKQLILLLFICLNGIISINAQSVIKGIVTDKKTNEPVSYASVYINGSSKKVARTDNNGNFKLEGVTFPCLLVVSHLNYNLKTFELKDKPTETMNITLSEKKQQLGELTVQGKSLREECLKEFREAFLGTDHWGNNAKLLNDSVLFFIRETDSVAARSNHQAFKINGTKQNEDTLKIARKTLSVQSKGPVLIDMPLLGYTLSVDLESFSVAKTGAANHYISMRGYFHFTPYNQESKRKQTRVEKNRRLVYYNSWRHFNRSLYNNSLRSNGYVMVDANWNDSLKRNIFSIINSDTLIRHSAPNEASIFGQKNRTYIVYYLSDNHGAPLNLRNINLTYISKLCIIYDTNKLLKANNQVSVVYFYDDDCKIRNDGTMPDNYKMAFRGTIGQKVVGAMLPNDYEPE